MSDMAALLAAHLVPFGYGCYEAVDPGPGLYAMWLRGTCLYVGMSEDLRRRISEHETAENNRNLDDYLRRFPGEIMMSVVRVNADIKHLRSLELQTISELRPLANARGGGGVQR